MKKIKIYDVNSLIVGNTGDLELEVFGTRQELAVIEGPEGFVVTCYEGVHFVEDSKEGMIPLGLTPIRDDDAVAMFPSHKVEIPIEDILEAPHREQPLGDYIRRFGHRLEANYAQLLRSIKKVGLDPSDYPRDA